MSKTIRRILVTSISCIVVGAVLFAAGTWMGGETGFYINRTGFHSSRELREASGKQLAVLEKTELDSFRSMDIETDYNDIEILPSEDGRYYLEYRLYTYGSEPQYHVSQDTLTFQCIQNPQTQMNVAGFMVWNTNSSREQGVVRVYVPNDLPLQAVSLTNSDGNLQYNGPDADIFQITSSYGNVNLTGRKAGQITISASDGTIVCHSVECDRLQLENHYGDTDLGDITASELKIDVSDGAVTMKQMDTGIVDIVNQYGSVDGKAVIADVFSLKMSDGSCSLKQADLKQADLENSYGSLDIELTGVEDDYNYDLKNTYGSITVGKREQEEKYEKDHGSKRNINASASDGDMVLSFTAGK